MFLVICYFSKYTLRCLQADECARTRQNCLITATFHGKMKFFVDKAHNLHIFHSKVRMTVWRIRVRVRVRVRVMWVTLWYLNMNYLASILSSI